MSMEPGSGLVPSRASTISELVDWKFCSAWSLVVKPTEATPSCDETKSMTESMSSCDASSETYAVMDTSLSTEEMMLDTIRPPTRKMPMMSSDRKMVMMEPSAVERWRVKPVSDSRRK